MSGMIGSVSRRGFMAGAAALGGGLGLPGFAFGQDAAPATVFSNANLFDGTAAALRTGVTVLVEGEKIAAIEDGEVAAPEGATVIDCGGRTLMPGLIDAHTHLFMTGASQAVLGDPATPLETLNGIAIEEARLMLLRGYTAVRDVGGAVFDLRRSIESGASIGPRIYPSGGTISQTSGHGDFRLPHERSRRFGGQVSQGELLGVGFIADGRDEVLTAVRENLRSGATQIKMMAGGGAASAYDPLDVAQYTLDEMKAGVEAADDWGTYVTVHAYTVKAVRRAVEAGVRCIEHGQLLDEETIKMLADNGIYLSLQALEPAPPTQTPGVIAKKQMVVDGTDKAFTWAKKYGVKLGFGSDYLFFPEQNAAQTKDIVKLSKWFSPAEALKLVTRDNAEILALSGPRNPYDGKLGVVEKDAFADLILVEGDPLTNLEIIGDPETNFRIIMKGGVVHKNTL